MFIDGTCLPVCWYPGDAAIYVLTPEEIATGLGVAMEDLGDFSAYTGCVPGTWDFQGYLDGTAYYFSRAGEVLFPAPVRTAGQPAVQRELLVRWNLDGSLSVLADNDNLDGRLSIPIETDTGDNLTLDYYYNNPGAENPQGRVTVYLNGVEIPGLAHLTGLADAMPQVANHDMGTLASELQALYAIVTKDGADRSALGLPEWKDSSNTFAYQIGNSLTVTQWPGTPQLVGINSLGAAITADQFYLNGNFYNVQQFAPAGVFISGDVVQPVSLSYFDMTTAVNVNPDGSDPHAMLLSPTGYWGNYSMRVDANHDGTISSDSKDDTSPEQPFQFWLNDDNDAAGSGGTQDYNTSTVDGPDDLADFFPVYLNLKPLINALPPSGSIKYVLKQADGAVNFVYTNLSRTAAFSYKSGNLTTGFGPSFDEPASEAETQQVTANGVELTTDFLANIQYNDGGVILVEGRTDSTAPLVLAVEQNGVEIAHAAVHLSLGPRILLLLHGMNSNTRTWDDFVRANFGDPDTTGAATIRDRAIQGLPPTMTTNGVRCYRLQFGFYDIISNRTGLADIMTGMGPLGVSASNTPDYLSGNTTRCGDFETFSELGREVDDSIDAILAVHPQAKIVLVGHSRGGIAARAFLETSGTSANKDAVVALLTTSSPNRGSPMGRIYAWLDAHPRFGSGTDADDWQVVDLLLNSDAHLDVRRPVIHDVADNSQAIEGLNAQAAVHNLPTGIRYAQIVYNQARLGFLARQVVAGVVINYTVFDGWGPNVGDQMSSAAEAFILGAGKSPSDYPGDGLIPWQNQGFTNLPGFSGVTVPSLINTGDEVLHTEAPSRNLELQTELHRLEKDWFP